MTINGRRFTKNMGSKFSRCLGLQSYVKNQEDYMVHPGHNRSPDVPVDIAVALNEDYEENPESFFYQGTEV